MSNNTTSAQQLFKEALSKHQKEKSRTPNKVNRTFQIFDYQDEAIMEVAKENKMTYVQVLRILIDTVLGLPKQQ